METWWKHDGDEGNIGNEGNTFFSLGLALWVGVYSGKQAGLTTRIFRNLSLHIGSAPWSHSYFMLDPWPIIAIKGNGGGRGERKRGQWRRAGCSLCLRTLSTLRRVGEDRFEPSSYLYGTWHLTGSVNHRIQGLNNFLEFFKRRNRNLRRKVTQETYFDVLVVVC